MSPRPTPGSLRLGGLAVLLATATLSVACTGTIADGSGGAQPAAGAGNGAPGGSDVLNGLTPEQVLQSAQCKNPSPGRTPLRRLSNAEYRNTVTDLLGSVPDIAGKVAGATAEFPSESESLGFRNSADFLTVPLLVAQKYMDSAEKLAEAAVQQAALVPCSDGGACAEQFIRDFGKRAFRRPLTEAEVARYRALHDKAALDYDFKTGIEWVVYSMLQSPEFLYRVEFGRSEVAGAARPAPHEMASRLSYLLWQSMPDDALLAAAEAGELETAEQVAAQARKMLADPKASRVLEYFDQWLDLDHLQELKRDPKVYPSLNASLPSLLRQETHAFVQSLLSKPGGSFEELLTAPYTFANATLAQHYGLTGASGSNFVRVETPGRAGILTQGMVLAHDKPTRTSIVRRGLKVRIDFLCQKVPAPPNDVQLDLESFSSDLSQRERLEMHRSEPSCAGCHEMMDPIGVAFENFDAVGRDRTHDESGEAVVTATTLTKTVDANGPVANAPELAQQLAQSYQARQCYVTQSFRFFYGRDADKVDACSMARLLVDFKGNAYSLSELLVGLTQTDAFLYRAAPEVTP